MVNLEVSWQYQLSEFHPLHITYAVYFHPPQDIDRNKKISAFNGKEFFLLDVIAHILHHLKNRLLMELRDHNKNFKASEFDWVITVPAIWELKGKSMMLEAGYMVSPKSNHKKSPEEV